MPQEYLLKRIRRNKQDKSNKPSRSGSMDDHNHKKKTQSIMRPEESSHTPTNNTTRGGGNVHFPTLEKMDTLIAIPPIDNRYDDDERKEDEKHIEEVMITEQNTTNGILGQQQQQQRPGNNRARNSSHDFFNNLTRRLRDVNNNNNNNNNNKQQNGTTIFNHRSIVASPSGSPPSGTMSPPQQQQQQQPRLNISRSSTWASTITKGINDKKPLFLNKKKQQQLLQSSHGRSHQAKALAKKIYTNITGSSGRQEITELDFYPYFRTNQEAAAAFRMFDRDGNGSISKSELRSTCVRIYRERKNLATSMRDLSQATGKLDIILMVVFAAIWAIIVCAAFGVNVGTDLMPLWSAFIAASFIFGNSAKDAFESIIFIFVTHPFDAGDRVLIGGENWVVGRVGLLVSTFINWDGSVVYAKNSVLASQYIINVRRTGPTGESLQIHIAFSTPSHKIRKLEEHMKEWANQYPGLYSINSTSANILNFENQNRLIMSFYFEHTQNWQDPGGRWLRHNNFMMELKEECERLNITYVLPSQPFESNKEDQHPNVFDNDDDDDENHSGGSSAGELSGIRTHRRLYKENPVEQGGGVRGPTASAVATATGGGNNNQSGAAAGAAATVAFTTGFM
ncbi:hypothetical protein INT45_002354 [Circinella minor]|uniref:EF-hand domain-containing protein n=1 Tax=Circinella minor TaxID=1195481 RepID=A0A8H7S0G2_9FUNG|nr:hypothetical protein INT45_002354 [Circinella minor]